MILTAALSPTTNQLFDAQKHALPSELDDCIRGTLQMLELRPLRDGETVEVNYPLSFSESPPKDVSGSDVAR